MIKTLPSSQSDEQDVPYDVDFLFTNIPLQETIDYIIHKIYNEKFLKSISKKPNSINALQANRWLCNAWFLMANIS